MLSRLGVSCHRSKHVFLVEIWYRMNYNDI
jgi:hypothetical protein